MYIHIHGTCQSFINVNHGRIEKKNPYAYEAVLVLDQLCGSVGREAFKLMLEVLVVQIWASTVYELNCPWARHWTLLPSKGAGTYSHLVECQ